MTVPALHFQTRDLSLLSELGEVGFLDTGTIATRHFPHDKTGRACQRRLQLYAQHGIVRPTPLQVTYADMRPGRLPTIHALTPRGAEVLTTLTGEKPRRFSSKDPKPETLLHRLGLARLQLVVSDACTREKISMEWIGEYDAKPGVALGEARSERFILCESFPTADGKTLRCWPDASTWLLIPGQAAGQEPANLIVYWEYDRSTETLTQVAAKLPGYQALLANGTVRTHWPKVQKPTVRIFLVVPSQERLENVAKAIKDCHASSAVRLATEGDVMAKNFLSAPIWQTVTGECRAILRSAPTSA